MKKQQMQLRRYNSFNWIKCQPRTYRRFECSKSGEYNYGTHFNTEPVSHVNTKMLGHFQPYLYPATLHKSLHSCFIFLASHLLNVRHSLYCILSPVIMASLQSDPEPEIDTLFSRTAQLFRDDDTSISQSPGSFVTTSDTLTSSRNSREFTLPFSKASTSGPPLRTSPSPTPLSRKFTIQRKPLPSSAPSTTNPYHVAAPVFPSHCIACAGGPPRPRLSKWARLNPARKIYSRSAKDRFEPIHSVHCPRNSMGGSVASADSLSSYAAPSPTTNQDLVSLLNQLHVKRDEWEGNEPSSVHVIELSQEQSQIGNGRTEANERAARRLRLEEDARLYYDMISREAGRWAHEDYLMALQLQADMVDQEMARASRDCAVCGDAVPIAQLPALISCTHEPKICAGCLASWIASELDSKGWRNIGCPESNCGNVLDHVEVQLHATSEVFQKYLPPCASPD
jgi:hypothetical protein